MESVGKIVGKESKIKDLINKILEMDDIPKSIELEINERLTEDQFDDLMDFIESEFVHMNGAINLVADFINYKESLIIDELEHKNDDNLKLIIHFKEIKTNEGTFYDIQKIQIFYTAD